MTDEAQERQAVLSEARKWIGTPYRHRASVLGHGCDCVNILQESWAGAGLMEREDLGRYSRDWHLHRGDERYLSGLLRYCSDVGETDDPISARGEGFNPMPADILMWQIGRTFSHSAIVTEWPRVVHASLPAMRVLEEDIRFGPVYTRKMRVFSFWGPR